MGGEDPVGQVRIGRGSAGHEVRLSDEEWGAEAAERSRSEVERAVRENWGRILAILCGQLRDIDLAEDALQDAAVAALQPSATATTVRVRNGERLLTDRPFAETKEQLGGYYLIDVPNLDEAVRWAAQCPAANGGSVEVRPLGMSSVSP